MICNDCQLVPVVCGDCHLMPVVCDDCKLVLVVCDDFQLVPVVCDECQLVPVVCVRSLVSGCFFYVNSHRCLVLNTLTGSQAPFACVYRATCVCSMC